jgi:CheY-like chemotaxis protein
MGVDAYLIKPVTREVLWDTLRPFGEKVDRVLIIDDDRDFCRLMARMLESRVRRYQVSAAHSGQEGLALLRHRRPDLVLLDMALPDMDGAQVAEHLRADPELRDVPIVIVSAQDAASADNLRGTILVTRPEGFVPRELVQSVQQWLTPTLPASR